MAMKMHERGVRIGFYPQRLSEDELALIVDLASSERLGEKSPAYAEWLVDFVQAELERRRIEDDEHGEPREVDVPIFDGSKWDNGQMADALVASGVAVRLARDEAPDGLALELLVQFDELLRSWAATRLRNS